jgi:hypothetical protein
VHRNTLRIAVDVSVIRHSAELTSEAMSFVSYFGTTPWTAGSANARPVPVQHSNHRQTSMPRAGFEHTVQMWERSKTIYTATGFGCVTN